MKEGTKYAAKLKEFYARVRKSTSLPELDGDDNPLHRLAVSILGAEVGEEAAARAVSNLLAAMADWNEIRVSTPAELYAAAGGLLGESREPCRRLTTALMSVFDRENSLSLDHLRAMPRREARQYLEGLQGVDSYAAAADVLWSLGGHAIPVHDRLMSVLREADLVHPSAGKPDVQAFLERNISAAEAREFCTTMELYCQDHPAAGSGSARPSAPRKRPRSSRRAGGGRKPAPASEKTSAPRKRRKRT